VRIPVGRIALLGLLAASPFVMVRALDSGQFLWLAVIIGGLQAYALAAALPVRHRRVLAFLTALAVAALVAAYPGTVLAIWPGVPHAVAYTFLLIAFGGSLRRGRVPMVTRFATRIHGGPIPEQQSYCRGVTILWTLFFAGQLAGSAVLWAIAPTATWIWFVTVLNLPLMVGLFALEYAWRCWRWRHYPRETLADMARLFGTMRADFGNPPPGTP
jgi:uncharacterized membrane protein